MSKSTIEPRATLETVERQFEAWRNSRTKKSQPIPEQLWQAAASLCENYPITHVCRQLRLSFADLKSVFHLQNHDRHSSLKSIWAVLPADGSCNVSEPTEPSCTCPAVDNLPPPMPCFESFCRDPNHSAHAHPGGH